MPTLSQCIRKAGKALDKTDADAIRRIRDELKGDGMSASDAGIEAVATRMGDVLAERDAILGRYGISADAFRVLPTLAQHGDRAFDLEQDRDRKRATTKKASLSDDEKRRIQEGAAAEEFKKATQRATEADRQRDVPVSGKPAAVDPYEGAATRPDTNEAQKTAGRSALRDLERRISRISGQSAKVLGSGLATNYREGRPNQLTGLRVEDSAEMALIAQVYRDPRFETLRFVFVKGGRVVGETAFSSRMPGAVSFGGSDKAEAELNRVKALGEDLGADGYYLMHNHPSGKSTPSRADISFTRGVSELIPGMKSHVVIDFNEYSVITPSGEFDRRYEPLGAPDPTPERAHPSLGTRVTSEAQAQEVVRAVADPRNPVVFVTTAVGNVQGITTIPANFEVLIRRGQGKRLLASLKSFMLATGSGGRAFLVLPEGYADLDLSLMKGVFTNAFTADGRSVFTPGDERGTTVRRMLVRDAAVVEEALEGLPETVVVDGKEVTFENFPPAIEAARKYMKRAGLEYSEPVTYAELDPVRVQKIASEFDRLEHTPQDPEVKAAYDAMLKETMDQYDAILETGLEVEFIQGSDPYGNPRNAVIDVVENSHLYVFSTRDGFGSDATFDPADNPLLGDTRYTDANGVPMLANDVFRIVHDYFGHIKNGVGFGARGEENAWQSHAAMYSPIARRAMTTETRGQNSWVNFGPYAEHNKTASGADTVYADQKIGLLPRWVSEEGRLSGRAARDIQGYTEGLQGAVTGGRLQISHFGRRRIQRTDPGLDRGANRYLPAATYFGITKATDDGYRRETGLGHVETNFSIGVEAIYPVNADPEGLVGDGYPKTIQSIQDAGYSGFWSNDPNLGKVAVIWDPLEADTGDISLRAEEYERQEPGFYSKLERAIVEARIPGLTPSKRNPLGAIKGSSWLQYLRNRGIKSQEWQWTGLRDFLNENANERLTREDLLSEVRASTVQISDVVAETGRSKSMGLDESLPLYMEMSDTEEAKLWASQLDDDPDNIRAIVADITSGAPGFTGLEYWVTSEDAKFGIIGDRYMQRFRVVPFENGLPTGVNSGIAPARSFNEAMVQLRSFFPPEPDSEAQYEEYIADGEYSQYMELKVRLPENPGEFLHPHFDDMNLVGFVRATLRDAGNSFFIEELQSDWHQQGRRLGYRDQGRVDALRNAFIEANERQDEASRRLEIEKHRLLRYLADSMPDGQRENRSIMASLSNRIDGLAELFVEQQHRDPLSIASPLIRRHMFDSINLRGLSYQIPAAENIPDEIILRLAEASVEDATAKKLLNKAKTESHRESSKPPNAPFANDAWITLMAKRALLEAVNRDATELSWAHSSVLADRWSDEYAGLYRELYDKKLPSIIRRLTGEAPREGSMPGVSDDPGFGQKSRIWSVPISEALADRVREEGLPLFKSEGERGGMTADEVRQALSGLPAEGVEILETSADLPAKVTEVMRSQGVDRISGYYDRGSETVYLVAEGLADERAVQRTLLHESIGHRGIERLFGRDIGQFLKQVQSARSDPAVAKVFDYVEGAYPGANEAAVASEVVARIAESDPSNSLVRRAILWIRAQLRRLGFNVSFTNADIVEALRRAKDAGPGASSSSGVAFKAQETDEELNQRMRERDQSIPVRAKKAAKRYLQPGGLLPPKVFEQKIKRDGEVEAGEMDIKRLVYGLEHVVKKHMGKHFSRLSVAELVELDAGLRGQPANLPMEVKVALAEMRAHIDRTSDEYVRTMRGQLQAMANDPDVSPEQAEAKANIINTILSNVGSYLHRSYRAYDDPDWPRNVPTATLNRARKYLTERAVESGSTPEEAALQAERVMADILKQGTAFDSMEAAIKESKLGAKDLSLLQRRKQIAPEIRALLGEYVDPRLNFAKTVSKMDRLINNERFLQAVKEAGMGTFLFEDGQHPPEAYVMFAAEGNETYSPLNGLRTYPEIAQAFEDALGRDKAAGWVRTIIQLNGMVKFGKTVLSPTTAARNFMSAMFFTLANGHFNPAGLIKAIKASRTYWKDRGGSFEYLKELKRLGVVYDTPYAGEMMRLLDDVKTQERLIKGDTPWSIGLDLAQKFYRWGDDFWKIVGYENEVMLLKKHYKMSEQEARVEAAERIRNTYPTYSMVGKAVNMLRRFPLAGTFVSFPAEIVRTSYHILRYAKQDMQQSRTLGMRKMAGIAIVGAFAHVLQEIFRANLEVDDEEDEAVRQLLAEWNENSNLLYLSRDGGKLRFLDISFLDPYNYWKRPLNAIMRDQPHEKMAADVAREVLSPFFGTDIAAGALLDVMRNRRGSGGRVFNPADYPEDQVKDIANHLWNNMRPGFMANADRLNEAYKGTRTRSGREYSMGDELAALSGFRISTYDPKVSLMYRTYEFRDGLSLARTRLSRILADPNPVTDEEIDAAVQRTVDIREQLYTEHLRLIDAARNSGLGTPAIVQQLRAAGMSKKDAVRLASGGRPLDAPTSQWMSRTISSARDRYDAETMQEFRRRRNLAIQLYRQKLREARSQP